MMYCSLEVDLEEELMPGRGSPVLSLGRTRLTTSVRSGTTSSLGSLESRDVPPPNQQSRTRS
jgi:hypothetical protein